MLKINYIKKVLFALICTLISMPAVAANITADNVLAKAYSRLSQSGSVQAAYALSVKNHSSTKGTLKVKGKKFAMITPKVSVWYNGKTEWNFNATDKECTITTPTAEELSQINPYALLSSYKTSYKASLQKSNIAGTYAVKLTPVSRQNTVKTAVAYIRSSDWHPVRLDFTTRQGEVVTIVITNIQVGKSFSDSDFVFNAKSHPGVELIDLR